MDEKENTSQDGAAPEPQFAIQRIYLKDASLELPNAPMIFLSQEAPQVDISLDVTDSALPEGGLYEVVVRATVKATTKSGNETHTVFLVECKQAGIFLLKGLPEEHLKMILGITCPTAIYPYLRSNISDLLTRAGLPPVYLGEINFEAYYAQRIQQEQAQQTQSSDRVQ